MYPITYDTFTTVEEYGTLISEPVTIPTSAVPVSVNVSYAILSSVRAPGFTELPWGIIPMPGQFRVFYQTNTIEFGPVAHGSTITVSYITWGTRIGDLPIQGMINSIEAIETTLGLNPQSSYGTVAARLAHIESSVGHTHSYINLTTQIAPGNNIFSLPFAPVQTAALLVFYNGNPAQQGTDYTLTGATLTFPNTSPSTGDADIPLPGDTLDAYYIIL